MKIKGIELDDINFLKDQIIFHFGTLKSFSIQSGVGYRKLLEMLNDLELDKKSFAELKRVYKLNVDKNQVPFRISDEERERIRIAIVVKDSTYTKFCKKNDEFDVVYISNVVNGKISSTRIPS